jgi:hypothetical protein
VANPAISSAEEALVFSCTPGNNIDVVMQLKKVDSDSWEGSYFYRKHGINVPLSGSLKKLTESGACLRTKKLLKMRIKPKDGSRELDQSF